MGFFDYFFGKKPQPKAPEPQVQPPKPAQQEKHEEQNWVYELILQYLTSPIWKIAISEFIDENCIVFDDEEENKLEYQSLHKKFKKLMANLVDTMMADLLINEEQFAQQVEVGLKHPKHKQVFEQLLTIDNFIVFKTMMIKRNKELELEALKQMQKADQKYLYYLVRNNNKVNVKANNNDIRLLELEKEKAELEHALQMSKAVDEERKKMLTEEDRQLQEVLRMSKYEHESLLKKKQEELEREKREIQKLQEQQKLLEQKKIEPQPIKQEIQQQQQQQQQIQIVQQTNQNSDGTPTPLKSVNFYHNSQDIQSNQSPTMSDFYKQPEQQKQEQKQQINESQQKQLPKASKKLDAIPSKPQPPPVQIVQPVIQQAESVIQFDDPQEDDKNIRDSVLKRLQSQRADEQPVPEKQEESVEERKKRLLEQRALIRQKKQEENEKALKQYKADQGIEEQKPIEQQQVQDPIELQRQRTQDELQRKRELLEKKKREILAQKIKQQQQQQEDDDLL